jgi:2-polyprenyl-3-methyl-5-hydroxy-6-metoxy-1,4-benzoquinol methylase
MKESEIRPQAIFEEFLRLAEVDAATFFGDALRTELPCPACQSAGLPVFVKSGFTYEECQECLTLYVNPRPVRRAFESYYTDSPSTRYWATTFYKETETARREKIWKPKAELIKGKLAPFPNITEIVDVGGGYGTFAEEIRRISDYQVTIIEPSKHLAEVCRRKGFPVIEKFLEKTVPGNLSVEQRCFISFELFEHLYDPAGFLRCLSSLMHPGDLFIFTTLNGTGVDIQVLWEHSKAVSPPHHLNFFNPRSARMLLESSGFEPMEITTPGRLDLSIIENNMQHVSDRFWKTFFRISSEGDKQDLQEYIAAHLLSSHMMVVCRKTQP